MARILYYPCPYCQKRMTRQEMVNHIDRKHHGELPEGFSPLRITFHTVNKKPLEYTPKCRICAKPTQWDEKKGRYNVLCDNPACRTAWIKKMKDTMGDKYGKYRPTETVEGLEKMLRGRRISGKYRFSDGMMFDYTGSYELEALKFMDQVLEIKSEELQTPGPVMQYELNGKLHYYIPDMYYIPYNLIIEVKDGGSRPNKNEKYSGTRERQMAKEKHVIEKTDYNYLRLTDKNMSQLLAVFADLKLQLLENNKSRVIHVNEGTTDYEIIDPDGEIITEAEVGETTSDLVQKIFNVVSDDGRDNAVCQVKGYSHLLRGRSTMIVLRKGGKSYQAFYWKKITTYDAPGGGWDPGESPEDAAVRETQEEARITVRNVLSCGFMIEYHHAVAPWVMKHVKKMSDWWYGYYTEVFVGMYSSPFNGKIADHDKDPILEKGQWFNIEDIIHRLRKQHKDAIYKYLLEKENFDLKESMGEKKEAKDSVKEGAILNENDIYYNKDKFDSGEINLCFVTGLSGSGKTTLANKLQDGGAETYELDDVIDNWRFSDKELAEYGDLIHTYFRSTGKKYRQTSDEHRDSWDESTEEGCIKSFVKHAMSYAKSHKDKKFVVEGVELYWFCDPQELKDYAVYIKGTSALTSMIRSAKRDSADADGMIGRLGSFLKTMFRRDRAKAYLKTESTVQKWRNYFLKASEKNVNENMFASIQGMMLPAKYGPNDVTVVNYMKNNVFSGEGGPEFAVSEDPKLTKMFHRGKDGKLYVSNGRKLLENKRYSVYVVRNVKDQVMSEISGMVEKDVSKNFVYETVFGHPMYTSDQIRFEAAAERYPDIYEANEQLNESLQKILGTE